MSKIYIIKVEGGSYDDAWVTNLFAVQDEERAQAEVAELQLLQAECEAMWPKINEAIQKGWEAYRAIKVEVPKEPKGLAKPTKETQALFKQEWEKWREEYRLAQKAAKPARDAAIRAAAFEAWRVAVECGATEKHLRNMGFEEIEGGLSLPSLQRDIHFSYEQLKLK